MEKLQSKVVKNDFNDNEMFNLTNDLMDRKGCKLFYAFVLHIR